MLKGCLRNLKKSAKKQSKTKNGKTVIPRNADYSRQFLKDWERLARSGRYDMERLKKVMLQLIANDTPLGPEWRDHALKGQLAKYRECHVGGDFLLVYRLDESTGPGGAVYFSRAGTHSELFN